MARHSHATADQFLFASTLLMLLMLPSPQPASHPTRATGRRWEGADVGEAALGKLLEFNASWKTPSAGLIRR